jgi:hypothetical protein
LIFVALQVETVCLDLLSDEGKFIRFSFKPYGEREARISGEGGATQSDQAVLPVTSLLFKTAGLNLRKSHIRC